MNVKTLQDYRFHAPGRATLHEVYEYAIHWREGLEFRVKNEG